MNNKNLMLQQRDNTQNIRSILIVFMITFSMALIAITYVKDESVNETRENTEIQTETTTKTSIPVTLDSQQSDTNSYVSNYFNAWELTKVI